MAVSQLRPVHARRLFPCLDEPFFRAVFSINIIHHPDYKVVSNMPIKNVAHYRDELVVTTFADTPPIPAFLVAVIISKMEEVDGIAGFSSLATPDKLPSMVYSAEIGPKLAAAMQNYIGLQYPLNKTHQVALPRLIPVAMENWGLYNFKEENILYLEGESPTLQKQTAARFSAHEICHAWMGNMVSLGWWDYLWMSEMYAMFFEYNIPHMVDPCWRMNEQLVIDLHQTGLLMDSMPVEPLTTSVLTPSQISNKFGGVTYSKGPAVLRMAIHILEEFNFLKGFQQLLINYAYKSIPNPETMWTYLEKHKTQELPARLQDIMSLWTTTSGYPVVNVVVQPHRILLSQAKFSLENDTENFQPWWIPLTFTTGRECNFEVTKPKDWFKPQRMYEINLSLEENDWILFNIKSVGFYRVNYNRNNWNNLIDQLNRNCLKFPAVNRAQLIDDSFNLARAGKLDYNTALTLGSYLVHDTDFIPWKAAITAFDFLDNVLLNSSLRSLFKTYIRGLVNNVYLKIGFEEKECDGHVDKINREQIIKLGCESGHQHCVENAKRYVSSLISGFQPKISVDVYETVMCSAVYYGGNQEWEYVLSLYQSAMPRRKSFYLAILGCSNDPDIIRRYITDFLRTSTAEEWMERFRVFANRKENVNFMLQILYEKYDVIIAKVNTENFVSLLKTMENFLTTEEQLKKITELESKNINGITDVKLKLQKRLQWLNKNLPQLSAFFNNDRTDQLVFSN
ncbi:aminopeptidase N-like isoform X2 [Rhodnius prolixus]